MKINKESKFYKQTVKTGNEVREVRGAELLFAKAEAGFRAVLNQLEMQKMTLEYELAGMSDFMPMSTISLNVTGMDVSPEEWAKRIVNTKHKIVEIEDKIAEANVYYEEWFGEEPAK